MREETNNLAKMEIAKSTCGTKRNIIMLILLLAAGALMAQEELRRHGMPEFEAEYPDVHDPVMAQGEDGRFYLFATGMGIQVLSSDDRKTWREEKSVFGHDNIPAWAKDSVHGYWGHTWAPDISRHDSLWYLYYSCSTFGKNNSAIGLAVNRTLDPTSPLFGWEDRGCVVTSRRQRNNWNAIDPNLYVTDDGHNWLTYGSFWDGIQLVELASDRQTPLGRPVTIARRRAPGMEQENAIEAPFIIKIGKWYYLLVSFDYCCKGSNSTYKTVYGRSRSIEGPYKDRDGADMTQGGGTLLVGPDERFYGVGHCAAYKIGKEWYFIAHAYDSNRQARAKLYQRKLIVRKGWLEFGE